MSARPARGLSASASNCTNSDTTTTPLTDITRGTPLLYFVARVTPRGSFSTSPSEKEAAFVESTLIGMALKRNTALKNVSGAKFLSEIHVPGLVNPKKGVQPRHVREFTALF
jgi:hypothetical protein